VDDSPFFRSSVKKTLVDAQIGSRYYEAKDGKEAISQYIAHRPNLVIMDIVMPNLDGVKATQAIKKYDPDAKIIVISSKENKEAIDDTINRGGAKDYVLKPLDSGQVVMAVSKQLAANQNPSSSSKKQEIESDENSEILNTEAKKIFDESLSAITDFEKKRMEILYEQLNSEKKLSKELNDKLHRNMSKIAKAEVEIVKKKKQLEEELDQKTIQLIKKEKLSAVGEMSARLSHDIRNPLNVIRASMENIQAKYGQIKDTESSFLRIDRAIDRIAHQTEDVLEFVQNRVLEKEVASLNEIISEVISSLNIPERIIIKRPKQDISLYCDYVKICTLLKNLIHNSIHACKDEGMIEIKTEKNLDSVSISIIDSGAGIPAENMAKIFEPLFTTKQQGTGLGLASCKTIIKSHGGSIRVELNPTCFKIMLPQPTKEYNKRS